MGLLNFYTIQILTSMFCINECISWLIKVTDCNNAWWKPEIRSIYLQEIFVIKITKLSSVSSLREHFPSFQVCKYSITVKY